MTSTFPRLCGLCGQVHPVAVRCAHQQEQDRIRKARHDLNRPSARERGYTVEWEKARAAFLKSHPYCYECGAPATTVDHKIPHRGDHRLFWDKANWQPLCTRCHSSRKQRVERRIAARPSYIPSDFAPASVATKVVNAVAAWPEK